MKRSLLCLLLALVLLCTTGCSDWEAADDPLGELSSFYQTENDEPEPEPLTALTLPYVSGETLDPVTATDTVQQTVGALLYEGLFALDQQFQPQPVLADSWEYDSQRLVWTIHIRQRRERFIACPPGGRSARPARRGAAPFSGGSSRDRGGRRCSGCTRRCASPRPFAATGR